MRIFVTGGSGWVGAGVVPELLRAGHRVLGLARSDAAAAALSDLGAEVRRGSLDDADVLREEAGSCDGVVHLAFKHEEFFAGNARSANAADLNAVTTFGHALAGTGRPLIIASGLGGLATGRAATEDDVADGALPGGERSQSTQAALALVDRDVRAVVVRLPPAVHGPGDRGFVATLTAIARDRGVSGYLDEGGSHWPAVHRDDAAVLFRLAVEQAPAGSVLHAVAESAVPTCTIAEAIGRSLQLPTRSVSTAAAPEHFGPLAMLFGYDVQASSARTRQLTGWTPRHPTLVEDIDAGRYTGTPSPPVSAG